MPIQKKVDKTRVNGSEKFSYTIDFSFSDLILPNQIGVIKDFQPSNLVFGSPIVGSNEVVKSISTVPVIGGTEISYNLGTVTIGTSGSFNFIAEFGTGRRNGDKFTNAAQLYANGILTGSASAQTVTLTLDENFTLMKQFEIKPSYHAGDEIDCYLTINNSNDPGADINTVLLTDILPAGLLPVTTIAPRGTDISQIFTDPTYNGQLGTWAGNTMTFALPAYHGQTYRVTFKVKIAPTVTPGQVILNTTTWTANLIPRNNANANLTIFQDKAGGEITKNAPQYATIGDKIVYYTTFRNSGTVDLVNFIWNDNIPSEVTIKTVAITAAFTAIEKYSIYIKTTAAPATEVPVLIDASGNNFHIGLTPFIPSGARVTSVILHGTKVFTNSATSQLYMYGTINNSATMGQSIVNHANFLGQSPLGNVTGSDTATTVVKVNSYLQIGKYMTPTKNVRPLDVLDTSLTISTVYAGVVAPTVAEFLPVGLEYLPGSDHFNYFDAETNTPYDSTTGLWPPEVPRPTAQVIKNYKGTGRTLVRWAFSGFTLPFLYILSVSFKALVSAAPPSSMINQAYLGNPGDQTFTVGNNIIVDALDLDGDTLITETIATSNAVAISALTSSIFKLSKSVKGQLDTTFSQLGKTNPSGSGDYLLEIYNSLPSDIINVDVVDILPHVGDTGVILTAVPRGSQFPVTADSLVTAKIINIIGNPVQPNPTIIIEYSQSYDPVRFDALGNPIGTVNDWSTTPPADLSTIRSFRVRTGADVILATYDKLEISIKVKASAAALPTQVAFNSFAARASAVTPIGTNPLLPVEPNKVGLMIPASTTASVGNLAWIDTNGDGIYLPTEAGINGVKVELFTAANVLVATQTTANSPATALPGYYLFSGLAAGSYKLKFTPPTGFNLTVQNKLLPNGSKPDSVTGYTDVFLLAAGEVLLTMIAGVARAKCTTPPTIYAADECIHLGSTFNPLADVSAVNCDGSDIPMTAANVTANDVDPSKIGVYHVTYSVTSPTNGLVSTKVITVKVCQAAKGVQAVVDLYQSVALQQAALSHILNAEGEKIQRAKALGFPDATMLLINDSVRDMAAAITKLEIILHSKLSLFPDGAGGGDCCK